MSDLIPRLCAAVCLTVLVLIATGHGNDAPAECGPQTTATGTTTEVRP